MYMLFSTGLRLNLGDGPKEYYPVDQWDNDTAKCIPGIHLHLASGIERVLYLSNAKRDIDMLRLDELLLSPLVKAFLEAREESVNDTAARMFKTTAERVTPDMRKFLRTLMFVQRYGGTAESFQLSIESVGRVYTQKQARTLQRATVAIHLYLTALAAPTSLAQYLHERGWGPATDANVDDIVCGWAVDYEALEEEEGDATDPHDRLATFVQLKLNSVDHDQTP